MCLFNWVLAQKYQRLGAGKFFSHIFFQREGMRLTPLSAGVSTDTRSDSDVRSRRGRSRSGILDLTKTLDISSTGILGESTVAAADNF